MNLVYLVYSISCLVLLPFSIIFLVGMIRKDGIKYRTRFITIEVSHKVK
jgi:hypothetical protein